MMWITSEAEQAASALLRFERIRRRVRREVVKMTAVACGSLTLMIAVFVVVVSTTPSMVGGVLLP